MLVNTVEEHYLINTTIVVQKKTLRALKLYIVSQMCANNLVIIAKCLC